MITTLILYTWKYIDLDRHNGAGFYLYFSTILLGLLFDIKLLFL